MGIVQQYVFSWLLQIILLHMFTLIFLLLGQVIQILSSDILIYNYKQIGFYVSHSILISEF